MKRGREYQGCGEEYNVEKEASNIILHIMQGEEGKGRKWPDKSTISYDMLDFISYKKNVMDILAN